MQWGAIKVGNVLHLFYNTQGEDRVARIGYARLRGYDQVEERLPHPVLVPKEWFERGGVEDPRVVALLRYGPSLHVVKSTPYWALFLG